MRIAGRRSLAPLSLQLGRSSSPFAPWEAKRPPIENSRGCLSLSIVLEVPASMSQGPAQGAPWASLASRWARAVRHLDHLVRRRSRGLSSPFRVHQGSL